MWAGRAARGTCYRSGFPGVKCSLASPELQRPSVLGPFTRAPHNPIVQRGEGIFGPGHGCAVQDAAGQWWHIYHQKRTDRVEWDRFIALDPLWFDDAGRLSSRATRGTPQPAPVTGTIPARR